MDKNLRLIRPEFMIVTGIPNHGKGVWVRSLCCNMAERHGLRTAIVAPEDPANRIKRDLRRFAMRQRYDADKHCLVSRTASEAVEWKDEYFRISTPSDDDPITLEFIENEMASAALHHDCKIFVCDPWNEIIHQMGKLTETQYIEQTLPHLKRLSRKYGLILIVVAHPRKMPEDTVPNLYSINGSANWKNKCDHGIIINRITNDDGSLSESTAVIVEKSKDHETMGYPGAVMMRFNTDTCDYYEYTEPKE